jgi:hypothetical protein
VTGDLAATGRVAACGVAASYLAAAVCAGLMPAELQGRPEIGAHVFWTVLAADPAAHLGFHFAWVAAGLFGLGAVPALSAAVWRAHPGAVVWTGAGAWLGFAVLARSHLMEVAFDRKIIPLYAGASPAFQEAVHVVAGLALDVPDGVLTHGLVGVWIGVVSWLAVRRGGAAPALGLLGAAAGLSQLAGVFGYALALRPLVVVAIGLGGGLLVPAWFVWMGVSALRNTRQDPPGRLISAP